MFYSTSRGTPFYLLFFFCIYSTFKYKAGKILQQLRDMSAYEAGLSSMDLVNHHIISVVNKKLHNFYRVVKYTKDRYAKPDGFQIECRITRAIFHEEIYKNVKPYVNLCKVRKNLRKLSRPYFISGVNIDNTENWGLCRLRCDFYLKCT